MDVRFSRNYIQKESEKMEVLKNEKFWMPFKDTDTCTLCEYVKDLPKQSRAEAAKKKKLSTARTTQYTDELQETVSNVKFSTYFYYTLHLQYSFPVINIEPWPPTIALAATDNNGLSLNRVSDFEQESPLELNNGVDSGRRKDGYGLSDGQDNRA